MNPELNRMLADSTAAWGFFAVGCAFLCASLFWAGRDSYKHHSAVPWLALLGGLIASFEEGWIDRVIQLWYPVNSPLIMFTAMGTPQPIYVQLVYPGFIGLGAYATYLSLRRHQDGRYLWHIFAAIVLMDLLFEVGATSFGVFHYYGRQPFQLVAHGWPAWVAPVNATGPILGGWTIFRLEAHLRGSRRLLIATLPPLAYAGVYGACAWPTATMMNSDVTRIWIWLAATVTMLACALIVLLLRASLLGQSTNTLTSHDKQPRSNARSDGQSLSSAIVSSGTGPCAS